MPIKRDADGNIIEQPTGKAPSNDDDPTDYKPGRQPAPPQSAVTGNSPYDAKTVLAGTAKREARNPASKSDDARTRIYRPNRPAAETPPGSGAGTAPSDAASAMENPPVGWLVVIAGPGQGNVVTLGNGANSIGRDASQRLSLDFGDEMISRTNHATITYDPRGKKFYIQHGGGTNLTYVNDQPVLAPVELQPLTHILIGNTTLRFVPLCGQVFDWDAEDAPQTPQAPQGEG